MPVRLHHVDLGGAGRPPLVVLHGLLGSSRNWQSAGKDLAAHFHVFALDARNHGRSPHDPEMSYVAMAGDVAAWLDEHGLKRVTLAGHSMGGKTAMLLACREPARVDRLVVVDIAPKNYRWAAHRAEFAAMNELDLTSLSSRGEAEMRFEGRVPDLGMRKFLATNLERADHGWRWTVDLPVLTTALAEMEKNSLEPGDHFAGPALFIPGGKSRYVQPADYPAIHEHFPAATIEVIAEAGHNPHMECRTEFVRRIVEFARDRNQI
ncbi:MAG TPA: alpha/beta fold hydrolase [Candidatus Didemnitutus sp.]|nr:alpha/beta fold hydrolase [Candidatus Didemnitutus sp.]